MFLWHISRSFIPGTKLTPLWYMNTAEEVKLQTKHSGDIAIVVNVVAVVVVVSHV